MRWFDRVGTFLSGMYSDQTHFIFELLQNAEDVDASRVEFRLYRDRLEFEHDGNDFNEKDIKAICKLIFGTKGDDLTKHGKFGVGFMSVYSFTRSPSIHSGVEHFTIENYEQPRAVSAMPSALGTLFEFPFNNPQRQPGECFRRDCKPSEGIGCAHDALSIPYSRDFVRNRERRKRHI